jgi:hypothetical protein
MPAPKRESDTIVELCRATDPNSLQVLVGAATGFWRAQGFTRSQVVYVTPDEGFAGIYVRKAPNGPPSNKYGEMVDDFTAVVIMSGEG